jgi:transposase
MGVITLSMNELEKIRVLDRLKSKKIKQIDAAKLLGKSERQVRRLQRRYQELGESGVASRLRGKVSNHRLTEKIRTTALSLIAAHYADFGPTLATEKLRNVHGIKIAVETVRGLMIEKHLWIPKRGAVVSLHLRRERRASEGELIQMDGSHHDWFEGRGPKCVLHVAIDDATSKIMGMRFELTESLSGYFELLCSYVMTHGRPLNIYVDRHSIFSVNKKDPSFDKKSRLTQFGRALRDLGINLIHARSSQAKGRVERVNRTLQDRLIKEMRLAGISDIESANGFLSQFIVQHNERFAKPAANPTNLHRPLESHHRLEKILTPQYCRVIQKDLTLSYEGSFYQIMNKDESHRLMNKKVLVWRDPDGKLRAELGDRELEILPLSQVLADQTCIPLQWRKKRQWKPGYNHPYRRYKIRIA